MTSLLENICLNTGIQVNNNLPSKNKTCLITKNDEIKDSLELSTKTHDKEDKTSLRKKLGIAGAVGIAAYIGFLIYKNKFTEAKKLAKEIEFKPAKTIEEAINFAKEKLGIKNIDGFNDADLDILNWVNEGMMNVSNIYHGKLRMPKSLLCDSVCFSKQNVPAGVINDPKSEYYGLFAINRKFFDDINNQVLRARYSITSNTQYLSPQLFEYSKKLLSKFNNGTISFNEKVFLSDISEFVLNKQNSDNKEVIVNLLKNEDNVKILEAYGIDTNKILQPIAIDKFNDYLSKINALIDIGKIETPAFKPKKFSGKITPFQTIYHEMGHIQDMQPRPLTVEKHGFDESKYSNELKEWINNKEYMEIANEVSLYASSGPGEFVAEVFAALISGNKLSNRVKELYKKLGGPSIPEVI